MESSTVCIALLLVLVAGLSTVLGECNQAKMSECVGTTKPEPTDKADASCKKMQAFMVCYDKYAKDCTADLKSGLNQTMGNYKKTMKKLKCEEKKDKKEKKENKGKKDNKDDKNAAANLQVSSLILSFSALLFVPAVARM